MRIKNLFGLLAVFKEKMRDKLVEKKLEGYTGWDDPKMIKTIKRKLRKNLRRKKYVNVANLAMMLYNLQQSEVSEKGK